MTDLRAVTDRVEIEALRGEYCDAVVLRDYERIATLFTSDGALRMPDIPANLEGPEQIRAWGRKVPDMVDFLIQNNYAGVISLDGDVATGRNHVFEIGRALDGRSAEIYAIWHDRYRRTPDGWRFAERVYEIRYLNESPLTGEPKKPAQWGTAGQ